MAEKSRILIIGATGYIGKFIAAASTKAGHPTFALIRESTLSNPDKANLVQEIKSSGIDIVPGDISDHDGLVKAIKEVDVVISTVGKDQLANQDKLIAAIKEAGNIKRFFPSEFGYFLPALSQPRLAAKAPPRDEVVILGDGNAKAIYNFEEDIASYTIRAVDDVRTLNKILYIRPPENIYSLNELVVLWEKKMGNTLERIYIPEEQVLKDIQESSGHNSMILSISHSVFVKGDQTNFEMKPSLGVEASQLYPDIKYLTVDEFLGRFV
ncbi:hypothetical protein SAY86_004707 [Trapa natans]|uniref:NmrA-like domain-containing protein n=1 Tax=Trapa natans TaxID=22666 RepID=A0AAN7RJ61_TRANT|nr:hypothetical protein SAY86_004707 [Trapa natans]